MFSKVTSAIRHDSARKRDQDDHVARIAISEDGAIAYASSAFCEISHMPFEKLKNTKAQELIRFAKAPAQKIAVGSVETGLHKVFINGHDEAMSFHFDWLKTPDNKRYLIGSESSSKKPNKAAIEKMASIITQDINRPQQKPGAQHFLE
jgi:hypothetical protein